MSDVPRRRLLWLGIPITAVAAAIIALARALRRTAEALRESEARFAGILDHAPTVIFLKDRQSRYLLANRVFEVWAGKPAAQIVGKTDADLFDPETARRLIAQDRAVLASGQAQQFEDIFVYQGRGYTFLTVKFPLPDATGSPATVCGIAMDITERKRAEAALEEADRRKDEFLATLAHELRNPLAPIRTGLEIMRRARGDAAKIEHAREIVERQVGQMVRLVDDLLDVGRITGGKLKLQRERVELARVIHSALETTRPLLDAKGHVLTLSLPDAAIHLDADLTRLVQVFANLLNNAVKFTPAKGRITLAADRAADEVVVKITDTGVGIAPEQRGRLFEMFAQLGPSVDRAQGGLGIGLALARSLVEMHGGRIEVHSDGIGQGSTFTVSLPVASETRTAATEAAPRDEDSPGPRLRVLVVDDNRDAADSLADLLHEFGHEASIAYGGAEAVAACAALPPDVVVLDIGMQGVNGYEAARRIRAEVGGRAPVLIALSGWGQSEDKRLAAEAGFDRHLTKPVDPRTLAELLRGLGA